MNQEGRKQKAESSGLRQPADAAQPSVAAPAQLGTGKHSAVSDSPSAVSGLSKSQHDFLAQVVPPALQSEREHGIPACVTIAQAILESAAKVPVPGAGGWGLGAGEKPSTQHPAPSTEQPAPSTQHPAPVFEWRWGGSILFREANNPFGIKHVHHTGEEPYEAFSVGTHEVVHGKLEEQRALFQRFPELASAFRAHALLFLNSPRYKPAVEELRESGHGAVGPFPSGHRAIGPSGHLKSPDDPITRSPDSATRSPDHPIPAWQRFATAIMNCGYSTDRPELCRQPGCPHYAGKLIKLVNDYRLNDPRALAWYATGQDPQGRNTGVSPVTTAGTAVVQEQKT